MSVYFDTDAGSLDKGAEERQATIDALKAMVRCVWVAFYGLAHRF